MSENKFSKESVIEISGVNPKKCMRCGKCTATCPAFDEMEYHPHQFVYMVESGEIDKLVNSPSIFKCLSCFACVDRCPRQVEPTKLIEAVRVLCTRRQGENHITPYDVIDKLDDDTPQQALVSAFRKYTE